jgi:hypothetical protein
MMSLLMQKFRNVAMVMALALLASGMLIQAPQLALATNPSDHGCQNTIGFYSNPKYVEWVEDGEYVVDSNLASGQPTAWYMEVKKDHGSDGHKASFDQAQKTLSFGDAGGLYRITAAEGQCANAFFLYVVRLEFDRQNDNLPFDDGVSINEGVYLAGSHLTIAEPEVVTPYAPIEIDWSVEDPGGIGTTIDQDGVVSFPTGVTGDITIKARNNESGAEDTLRLHIGLFDVYEWPIPWESAGGYCYNVNRHLIEGSVGDNVRWRLVTWDGQGYIERSVSSKHTRINRFSGGVSCGRKGEEVFVQVKDLDSGASDVMKLQIIKLAAYEESLYRPWEANGRHPNPHEMASNVFFDHFEKGFDIGRNGDAARYGHLSWSMVNSADVDATINADTGKVTPGEHGEHLILELTHYSGAKVSFNVFIIKIEVKEESVFIPWVEGGTYDPLAVESASDTALVSVTPSEMNDATTHRLSWTITNKESSWMGGYRIDRETGSVSMGTESFKMKVSMFDPLTGSANHFLLYPVSVVFENPGNSRYACTAYDYTPSVGNEWLSIQQSGQNKAAVRAWPEFPEVYEKINFHVGVEAVASLPVSKYGDLGVDSADARWKLLDVVSKGPLGESGVHEELAESTHIYAKLGIAQSLPNVGRLKVQVLPARRLTFNVYTVLDLAGHQSTRSRASIDSMFAKANEVLGQANIVVDYTIKRPLVLPLELGRVVGINDLSVRMAFNRAVEERDPAFEGENLFLMWEIESRGYTQEEYDAVSPLDSLQAVTPISPAFLMYIIGEEAVIEDEDKIYLEDSLENAEAGVILAHEIGHLLKIPVTETYNTGGGGHVSADVDRFNLMNPTLTRQCHVFAEDLKRANVEAGKR